MVSIIQCFNINPSIKIIEIAAWQSYPILTIQTLYKDYTSFDTNHLYDPLSTSYQ